MRTLIKKNNSISRWDPDKTLPGGNLFLLLGVWTYLLFHPFVLLLSLTYHNEQSNCAHPKKTVPHQSLFCFFCWGEGGIILHWMGYARAQVCIYIYIYNDMCIYIYTYNDMCIYTYNDMYMYIYIYIMMCVYIYMYTYCRCLPKCTYGNTHPFHNSGCSD